MGDIELVIKISEEEYINIKEAINGLLAEGLNRDSLSQECLAILEGTPLPKGHGRIGDLDALREEVYSWGMNNYDRLDFIEVIDEADTIIEADSITESSVKKQKTGKWIRHDTGHSVYYDCSLCSCCAPCTETADKMLWKLSNFCPDCGAKMENN